MSFRPQVNIARAAVAPAGHETRGALIPQNLPPRAAAVAFATGAEAGQAGLDCFGKDEFLALAERAAWNAWEEKPPIAQICCGLAGQAYALLCLFQHTGDSQWLRRARELEAYLQR